MLINDDKSNQGESNSSIKQTVSKHSSFEDLSNNYNYSKKNNNYSGPKVLFSKTFSGKSRKFYVDIKESSHGPFLKISEMSKGQKKTIMMDAEDFPTFMGILNEGKQFLQ